MEPLLQLEPLRLVSDGVWESNELFFYHNLFIKFLKIFYPSTVKIKKFESREMRSNTYDNKIIDAWSKIFACTNIYSFVFFFQITRKYHPSFWEQFKSWVQIFWMERRNRLWTSWLWFYYLYLCCTWSRSSCNFLFWFVAILSFQTSLIGSYLICCYNDSELLLLWWIRDEATHNRCAISRKMK